eukprot:m.112542 g.112542  ORF g.112542 m.112542 type:complete len:889 (+) comp10786_c1_seq2:92-2758(+)
MIGQNCTSDFQCSRVDCGGSAATDSALCVDGQCWCAERAFFFVLFGVYMLSLISVAIYARTMAPGGMLDSDANPTEAGQSSEAGQGTGGGSRGAGTTTHVTNPSHAAIAINDGAIPPSHDLTATDNNTNTTTSNTSTTASTTTSTNAPPSAHLVLMDHFMPRAGFGGPVMAFTLFSTLFSGYSVIGIPDDTFKAGFYGLRWLASTLPGLTSMLIFYPRFRRVGLARNYASPSDVFADRFNCQSLRLLATMIMLFVQLIYTAAQFKAIYDIIDAIALGRVDAYETTAFIMVVTVICDWIGGQRGIALSDSLQAGLMIVSFLTMPFVVSNEYRSFSEVMSTCTGPDGLNCIAQRRPWFSKTPTVLGSCLFNNQSATDPECFRSTFTGPNATAEFSAATTQWGINPDELTILDHQTLSMFGFIVNGFAFPMQTHFLQKLFLARSEAVIRHAMLALAVSAFMVFFPAFYYGMLTAADFPHETMTAVPMLCGKLMDKGGFPQFIAIVSLNAVLAAMMSTADSTIIGGTNIWICTWTKGFLLPGKSARVYSWLTFITTPFIAWCSLTFAVHAKDVRFDTLISIQNSVNWQAIPAFTVAMYSDRLAAYPLLCGMVVGLVITLSIEAAMALDHEDNEHHTLAAEQFDPYLPSGVWGVMANIVTAVIAQRVLESRGSSMADDSVRSFDTVSADIRATYGAERLTAVEIARICAGSPEPMEDSFRRMVTYAQGILMLFALPWYAAPFTDQGVGAGGFPQWAGVFFGAITLSYLACIYCIWSWDPNDTPIEGLHFGGAEMARPDRFKMGPRSSVVSAVTNHNDDDSQRDTDDDDVEGPAVPYSDVFGTEVASRDGSDDNDDEGDGDGSVARVTRRGRGSSAYGDLDITDAVAVDNSEED